MKKLNLSFMAIMNISLVIILIMSSMAVFAYRNEVYTIEARKDNLLNFNIKYNNFINTIHFDAKQYIQTNDEKYKLDFYNHVNDYLMNDSISLEYRIFSQNQATDSLKDFLLNNDFTISSQVEYLQFNDEEQQLYRNYLESVRKLIGLFHDMVAARDYGVIMSPEFNDVYSEQSQLLTALSKSYLGRLNQQEDNALRYQKFFEYIMATVSLLLLCFAAATFCLILRENAYNSYFSKLYNTVVENIDGGIAILDNNYRFEYMNPKYREILGIADEDPKGKTLHDTFEQSLADTLENATLDNPSGEGKLDLIIGNKKTNILYSCFAIKDERGNNKYIHLLRDNTKTEELQAQLRKQLQEIKFYSQAKDSFIANISHEIKTPINAILGMVHFLKRSRLSQNQKDLVRKIETSSDILLTIISDVLDLSRIKNNSLSLYPSDFCLETAIRNVEDMFSSQLSAKGIEWRTEYDFKRDLCLHLDKTRFLQVLVNLVNNACKFTESGYVKLSVETLSENEDFVLLQFCVEDTGIGIAEKDISKLFREFEQLENHLTKQHQGTGLGLFICKNIIESMDGRMWVQSTKGQGSKFYFTLPAKKALTPVQSDSSDEIKAVPLKGKGGRALVVEDTEINAEVAARLLKEVHIACDIAEDGATAIEMCRNKPSDYYNVILMDIHMPNMDGYTTANILKKELSVKSPIVALTASEINDQIRTEHADTIESFILKPFKAEAFYSAISPYFSDLVKTAAAEDKDTKQPGKPAVAEIAPVDGNAPSNKEKNGKDPLAGREDAIKNLGGLESIYNKHIKKFKANYANTAETISALLKEKKYDEARCLVHSVKGLGGTLGMLYVMESGAELEKAILKGEGYDLSAELEKFDRELQDALDAI